MTNRNADIFMHHMMRQKQKQLIHASRLMASGLMGGSVSENAENENVRMSETRIYIGLNDADTKQQIYETEEYLDTLKKVCRNYHVAFSVDVEAGGYYHEDGEYTEENSLVLIMIDQDKDIIQKIAKDLCNLFHQESVLITENRVDGCFISHSEVD